MPETYEDQLRRVERMLIHVTECEVLFQAGKAALAAVLQNAKRYDALKDAVTRKKSFFSTPAGIFRSDDSTWEIAIPGRHESFDAAVDSLIEKGGE